MDIVGATVAVQRRRGVIPIVQQRTSPQIAGSRLVLPRMRNRCSDEELAHEHLADSLRESAGTSHKHLMHLLGKISEKRTLTGQKQTRREAGRCS